MEILRKDLKHALRMFRHSPGFTATAVAALALGIGANTAIFSVIDTVLLKPLSYPEADRIVQLMLLSPQGEPGNITSIPKYMTWREQTNVFEDVAAYDFGGPGLNLTGTEYPEQLKGIHASASYFRVFRAPFAMGRPYTGEEDRPGGPALIVISNGLWKRRFGADPNIVGKPVLLGGEPHTVIGVLGPGFATDPPADVFLPLKADPTSIDQAHYLRCAARLRPGVSVHMAKTQMGVAADQYRRKFPAALQPKDSFTAEKLQDMVVSDARTALLVLAGAVTLVLLIACANVANLLLARATGRKREIAIRAAIGAGRWRIIRQLLTESVLLSVAGGVLGLLIGMIGVRALLAANPGDIPRIGENGSAVTMDWRVLAFTMTVSLLTGIVFGLFPAVAASRADLGATLKESGSRSGSGFRQNKARSLLVITETALALILLAGSALLIRTFVALRHVTPGFDRHNVLTMQMSLTGSQFEKTAGVAQLIRTVTERLDAMPGVIASGTTCSLPLEPSFGLPITVEGRPLANSPYHGGGNWRSVSPRYFQIFKIPMVRGRAFTERDDGSAPGVVVINETMAKRFWPQGDPLAERITIGKNIGPAFNEPPRQIIGIVADVRDTGLNRNPDPIMYVPVAQVTDGMTALNNRIIPITWIVRTNGQPFAVSEAVQREIRTLSGGLPVARLRSMEQVVSESTARSDFNMLLLTIFGASALLLAAIGLYGLMAYSVEQRTQEIGIRMALGAGPRSVLRMVVAQGMQLAAAGVVLGVGAALALSRLLRSLIFGVSATDPVVFLSVAALLTLVAFFATWLPARRATRIDPITALRYE
jgi:predicted permease